MENEKITASFVSLGCFKNVVDTEVLGGMLEKYNIRIVSSYEDSDWIIINTCGFIREAKEEGIEEILAALEKKESGETKHVAIFGCLTQRYYEELKTNFKKADIIWGVNDLDQLARLIAQGKKTEYKNKNLFLYDDTHNRIITTTPNSTFIKISEGCNMQCSFCAIPQIRGPFRSRTIDSIIKEAGAYKEMDFQEINLISQNSTYFGKDRGPNSQLPELLKEISSLGFSAVRVLYLMPEEVTDEIIAGFSFPTIIPYFDLPFQHVSAALLKRMKRSGGSARNLELLKKIRGKFREAVIRSSFIVGFPGETRAEFEELVGFAVMSKIERFGVFGYSDEENTGAFKLKKKNPQEVIEARKEVLLDISDQNMEKYNKKIMGTAQDFLPLGPSPWDGHATIGRITSQAPETDGFTQVNEPFEDDYHMFKIKITGFKHEMVYGERL